MSAFDDLLDLGGPSETTQQSVDPFDPFASGLTTNQYAGNSGGSLIDIGFDAEISTENGGSGTVNFEDNTNPFFEITNTDSKMASESANTLIEVDNEPAQKDFKSEPTNLLYEYMQNEGNTNGHAEEGLTNGGQEEVDLLGDGESEDEHSRNLLDDNVHLLGNSGGPVISDDSGVAVEANNSSETQPEEVMETRNRSSSESSVEPDQDEDAGVVQKTEVMDAETRNSIPDENALKVNGIGEISENGDAEEEVVHFEEMNNVRQKFESAGNSNEEHKPRKISVQDDYDKTGGEFENEPVENPDVVKESDQLQDDLPEVGMAKSMLSKFRSIQEENEQPVVSIKRASPARESVALKVEYESQPTESLPQYEGQIESGVFESQPKSPEDVVRSHDQTEDFQPEEGSAKNIMNKFKEIQTESSQYKQYKKREITPDRSGKVEYVSEPRGEKLEYNESQTESGVFENVPKEEEDVVRSGDKTDEVLPEAGLAKSLLSKFKKMESDVGFKPPPSPKREITPDRSGKVEYVSEPRGYLEKYEPTVESGEYESQPVVSAEVVRSEDHTEEILPEVGSAKKTMEMFKEIQKQSSSPVSRSKEFTPPREPSPSRSNSGVVESTPIEREDVVKSGEAPVDQLPEEGTTRNILNKFKEIQSSSGSGSPIRKQKEFTPPPEAGVYENTPDEHLVVETRLSESGVLESTPSKSVADISRDREATPESELPEEGTAKNLVSRWKHIESTSSSTKSTSSASPRFKEFTPPRDSQGLLSPKSPTGLINGVHPSDLPGQYQPQESTVIHENKPDVNEDVYRESDTDWTDGMPAANTTSSMLQRFKSIQEDAKANEATPEPISRKGKNIQHE